MARPFLCPLSIALFAAVVWAVPMGGQTATETLVRVQVRDSSGAGLPGVDISILRGLNEALASGTTNERGYLGLAVPLAGADYHLVARKIGYGRSERFFRASRDTVALSLELRRVVQQLDAVTVTAEQNLKQKSYHIDADEIANSTRVLIDATDILAKLRPDMICGRSCSPMASVTAKVRTPMRACPTLVFQQPPRMSCPASTEPPSLATNVWVNGQRIRLVAPDEAAVARQTGVLAGLSPGTMTVLSEIKPEHIDAITYVDEFDTSIDKIGAQGGLFIVLKEGIAYEPGKPSYLTAAAAAPTPVLPAGPVSLPAYRYRLLGVFDPVTGDPIEGADVIDMRTLTKARTSVTGTVSLIFLPEGGTPVRVVKAGYEDLTLAVEISAEHLAPLTLAMVKLPPP